MKYSLCYRWIVAGVCITAMFSTTLYAAVSPQGQGAQSIAKNVPNNVAMNQAAMSQPLPNNPANNSPNSPTNNAISLNLSNQLRATISFTGNNVIAQLSDGKKHILVSGVKSIPAYARDIWIHDFTFDGTPDVAVTSRLDPASSEQFYTIFIWDRGLQHFIPLIFKGGLSNLEIEPGRREIRSSYQDGTFWVEDTYRFRNQQPFLYSKSELVANGVWHTSTYAPNGSMIRSLVSNDGRVESPPQPVLLSVSSQVAPLYKRPLPSTKLPQQLKRGDIVTVLDFKRGPGQFNWVSIRTNSNNQVLQGWVLLSNLLDG